MSSSRRLAFILLLLLAVAFPGIAETVASMPAPTGYIDDYASVLSPSAKAEMETTARELHDKTGAQVFLVTINTLEGEPVETFANELFAKWKIGEKKTDRGALMLFAIKERKRWIEIGYGLEGILNDARVGDIGREMVPSLRTQDYDDAAQLGLTKICSIVATDSNVTLDSLTQSPQSEAPPQLETPAEKPSSINSSFPDLMGFLLPLLWFGIILFFIIRSIVKRKRDVASGESIGGSTWSDSGSNDSGFSSGSDDSFGGGDGGSSGGGGAGGDW